MRKIIAKFRIVKEVHLGYVSYKIQYKTKGLFSKWRLAVTNPYETSIFNNLKECEQHLDYLISLEKGYVDKLKLLESNTKEVLIVRKV